MHKLRLMITVFVLGSYAGSALPADIEAGKKIAQAKRCGDCHGAAGISPEGTSYPNLAGQKLSYLRQTLAAYRDKTRQHPLMTEIAKDLSDSEIANLAAYFASLSACP